MSLYPRFNLAPYLALLITAAGVSIGLAAGFIVGVQPILLVVFFVAFTTLFFFFKDFEKTVLGLLILRSSLDIFSAQQLPAAFAIGIDILALLYVAFKLISRQKVQTDGFFYFFAGWVAIQGLWVILLPLGGLGLGASALDDAIREWIRLFSFLMIYLLVLQLKEKISPEKAINALFLSLIAPLTAACMQTFLPASLVPKILLASASTGEIGTASRINGTLGHPNSFATFALLFLGLTLWKFSYCRQRLPWALLLAAVAFFLVATQSLTGLVMLLAFAIAFFLPRMSLVNLVAGTLLILIVGGLFLSSEAGQVRLNELYSTPLLNPDIDWSRSVAMQLSSSSSQANSFNWRVTQWTFLLQSWEDFPILGYGLGTTKAVSIFHNAAHNDYIRALVEGGIVGLSCFLVFLLAQAIRLLQLRYAIPQSAARRDLCSMMLAFLASMCVGMLAGNVVGQTPLWFYWCTLLSIVGWNWTQPSNHSDRISHKSLQPEN
ncbi:O-antigen ligase family protein [Microcoleus sp. FACHB-1515]|uniref:O-antigen ligase family protein n=1 Tax=Cyanophyceae TaxID=3028117 RepID=UPI0016843378|nr:O-antigen ligase family protein [Microcoleus sp. FACHB-1515]MBD2089096.1 O-antigen ligase family protein [Microcoleus sp. FACHB-1515]